MIKKLPLFFLICFTPISFVTGQVDRFEFSFPYSHDIAQLRQDSLGYLWFHDNRDFYKYNGHQIQAMGLVDVLEKRKYDFVMNGEIIFNNESILIYNGEKLSLIHPRTKQIRDLLELPYGSYFEYLYEDELGHLWLFTSSWQNASRPVYRSEDGITFNLAFDLFDSIRDRGIFWDYELGDKLGVLYLQWRLGDLTLIDKTGLEIELDVLDKSEFISTKSCSQFRLDNQKNLWRIHNTDFQILNTEDQRFEQNAVSGKFEFITDCKKVMEVTNKKMGLPGFGSLLNLRFIYTDSKGRIWFACAASYLVCYDPEIDVFFGLRTPLVEALEGGDYDIFGLLEDADGNIWGHKKGGVFKIREKGTNFEPYVVNTIDKNHKIYADKTNTTLNSILDYYNDYAIRNSSIHSISQFDDDKLIFQEAVYTYQLDLETKEVSLVPIFSPKESLYMRFDQSLKLFSTWRSYYKIYDDFTFQKLNSPLLKVENTLVQNNGDVWVTGLLDKNDYLFGKLNKESLEFEGNFDPPKKEVNYTDIHVIDMDEDELGRLWLATNVGLQTIDSAQINVSSIQNYINAASDTINIGRVILQLDYIGNNQLWFLTYYEVCLFNTQTQTIDRYFPIDETIGGKVMNILPKGDSVIWMANEQGISYYNFNTKNEIHLSKEDGLDARGAVKVLYQINNGDIAAGTNNGLYVFNPDDLVSSYMEDRKFEQKIEMRLNSYELIDGDSDSLIHADFLVDSDLSIDLEYNDKMLEIEYSLLNFNSPERHLYSYQLEGYDDKWSSPSNLNSAKFTSLPPGHYSFNVRGARGRGQWSHKILSIPITVNQAWFRTWWFILSCIALIGLLVYFLLNYFFTQKLQKRMAIESLRNKISSDLHDDVGTILAGLSMHTQLLSLKNTELNKEDLLELSEMSHEAMERMRDIVWAMNADLDNYEDLVDRMADFAQKQFSRSQLDYTFDAGGMTFHEVLDTAKRQNLYFIFKETITNAIKHSNGTFVKIKLSNRNGLFRLSVKDNGNVYDSKNHSGMGMKNIKMRTELIKGQLTVLTTDGYEVCVEV